MRNKNLYIWTGLSLLVAGILIGLTAHFVLLLTWLTALGTSMLILAFILLALGRTIPKLSPEASRLLLQTGIDSTASLIEELGIKSKAIYLPSSLTGDRPRALVPLHANGAFPTITSPLPRRLIVRYGTSPNEIGLLLTTAGTTAAGMLELKPNPLEFEAALTTLFIGTLGIADKIRVTDSQNSIMVEVRHPQVESETTRLQECLGGTLASIAASVAAEAWNKPVTIKQEKSRDGACSIELEVLA